MRFQNRTRYAHFDLEMIVGQVADLVAAHWDGRGGVRRRGVAIEHQAGCTEPYPSVDGKVSAAYGFESTRVGVTLRVPHLRLHNRSFGALWVAAMNSIPGEHLAARMNVASVCAAIPHDFMIAERPTSVVRGLNVSMHTNRIEITRRVESAAGPFW